MACIVKVGNEFENLSGYNTFIKDTDPQSKYFKINKFPETFTSGKNLFLMEGTPFLKESTAIKIEIVDVDGNTLYVEPGRGIPDYYEGNSVVLSSHVYDSMPVGPAKITVLGELKEYEDSDGIVRPIPNEWENAYNVKWERNFYINKNIENSTPVIFYKRPSITIEETEAGIVQQIIPDVTQSGSVQGRAENPPLGTDLQTWRAGILYRLEITEGPGFTGSIDENTISIPSLNYSATVREVLNKNTVLVDKPYSINNRIVNFESSPYTSTFEYFDGRSTTDTIVTGSYQKIVFKNLDTFTGNVDKVKIYRKSRSDIGDFKFLEEIKIKEAKSDLLVDDTIPGGEVEGGVGRLTETHFVNSWSTSSIDIGGSPSSSITFDNDLLYESIKINVSDSNLITESVNIITNTEFEVYNGVDYELNFNTLLSGSSVDVIEGITTIVSESYSKTTYYKYDPTKLPIFPVSFISSSGYDSILIQSSSQDLTRNYVYDSSRLNFYNTPQNTTGSSFTSIPIDYSYDSNELISITFDTSSGAWGNTSLTQTSPSDNANVVSNTISMGGVDLNVMVWLDSGSYNIPMDGNPQDVNIYSEFYSSGSNELAIISFQNIGGDAKIYYYNSSTNLNNLESFRNSTEYSSEPIDINDYTTPQSWHTSGTGSQVIIPFNEVGHNYIHIDYRTNRNIEPLNAELVTVKRLDRLNDNVLYGESYTIISINFETGDIEFSDGKNATFSGTLNIQNGQLVLTIDGETQTAYLVEVDFNNSVMVFLGKITVGDLEPSSVRHNLYELFQLSGSDVLNTTTSSFVVPRVPTQGGDYIYTEAGYPFSSVELDNRDFLTTVYDSPSSSLEYQSPLEIPHIFRNDNGLITDVYTFDSSSGQVYNVSSLSSSVDINLDSYVYDNIIVHEGFVPSGSINNFVSVDSTVGLSNSNVNLRFKQHDFLSGSLVISLLTDDGVSELPTGTGSVEYYIESFVSESGYQSGNTIWRNSFAFRNLDTDAMLFYNHSPISQSAVESVSGSVNYILSSIDTSDFQNLPLRMLESGSQSIFDFEVSGSGYNYIYLDYRTNRKSEVLNANLEQIGLVYEIDGSPISSAIDVFALSGSNITSITSASYYVPQVAITASNNIYDTPSDYPFYPSPTINDGNYIADKTTPGQTETILNSPLNIPYVFNVTSGSVNEVVVKRIDAIYTASSVYGTTGTSDASVPVFVSKSLKEPDTIIPKTLKFYLTGSNASGSFKQYISEISADSSYATRKSIQNLITSDYEGENTRLGIEARGDGWQIAKIDIKPATAVGFSPKVFKTVQEENRNLPDETFDYNFEMYDVNNNYIPVELKATKRFTQGNKPSLGTLKLLTFESDKTAFRFYTGSLANPSFQQIRLVATKQNVTGSLLFSSAAFDTNGQYIEPSSYVGTYPGGLTSVGENGGIISIANFSGSDSNYNVGSIIYTASIDGLNEYETVFRLEDGLPAADLLADVDRNTLTYKLSDGELEPTNQISRITVKRKNLQNNGVPITANSSSYIGTAPPLTLLSDNSTTGLATYFLNGSDLNLQTGSVTYEFSSSDSFGFNVSDSVTITPISFLAGTVLYLSNERGVLPAYYSGIIPSSSYVYTSGSTKLYVGSDEIQYDNLESTNSYKIIAVTGSGITPNEINPTSNNYGGIPGTMPDDSSSLEVAIKYIDSSNTSYYFSRTANFNLIKEGEVGQPGLEGSNGPGVVFTGPWDIARNYTVTSGSLPRKDAVLFDVNGDTIPETYFLAITGSGPDSLYGSVPPSGSISSSLFWEELGTGSNFVAAKIAIFEESYIQNTLNIGTNNSGSTSAANITLAGGTNSPYISIDQGATTGTQGYNVGNGIFLGINGHNGTGSLSLESPVLGGGELLWDGKYLNIRGNITVTNNEDFITPTDTGSFTKNEFTQSLINPTEYSFGSVFSLASASAVEGLNLTADYLGYYDGNTFNSYMDSYGRFYLGGTNGALQWDGGSNLVISGSIHAINGFFSGDVTGATVTGGSISGTSISGSIISGSTVTGGIVSGTTVTGGSISGSTVTGGSISGTSISGSIISGSTVTGGIVSGSTISGGTINIGSGNFTVNSSGDVNMAGGITLDGNINMDTNSSIYSGFLGGWNLNPSGLSLGAEILDYNGLFTVGNASLEFNGIGRNSEILYFERIGYPSPASNNYSYLDIKTDGAIRLRPDVNGGYSFDNHVTAYSDFRATGNITAYYSDERLKDIQSNILEPLIKIKSLNGFYYNNNELANSLGLKDRGTQVGLSAQQVQNILPEIVAPAPFDLEGNSSKSGENYLTIQYERLVPLLVEGIKELTERVEKLEEENKKLKG
jgi:hypothetical protein